MAALKAVGHFVLGRVGIGSAVPDDDFTGAVLALRDHSLECRVFQWMILGAARHPPVLRVCRRPFGYRPGYEHPADFEAEVVVIAARRVVLDDGRRRLVGLAALRFPLVTRLGA